MKESTMNRHYKKLEEIEKIELSKQQEATIIKFITFLVDNELMSKFLAEIGEKYNIYNVDSFYKCITNELMEAKKPERMISYAFMWCTTADGDAFWHNIDKKWKMCLKNNIETTKEQFNSIW